MPIGTGYSPHFVVNGTSDYLGVRFLNIPDNVKPNSMYEQRVALLYADTVDYSELTTGVDFEIREGGKTVGKGMVM